MLGGITGPIIEAVNRFERFVTGAPPPDYGLAQAGSLLDRIPLVDLLRAQLGYEDLAVDPKPETTLDMERLARWIEALDLNDERPYREAARRAGIPDADRAGEGTLFERLCRERLAEADGSCVYGTKIIHYRKGAVPFFVNLHACPISYKGTQAIIIAATDITEMIEKDAQLIQASKMKTLGEMSAGIAHELNQPLNAIKMGSDYLNMVLSQPESGGACVPRAVLTTISAEMSAQVDRATEIINTLRAFGRKTALVKEELDLNVPVRGVMNIVGQQFKLQNIQVNLDLAPDMPPVMAHDNRLQQVLFNLVSNARDAILARADQPGQHPPADSNRIDIRTYAEGGHVYLSVADTGQGIAEEDLPKVFEPFYTTKTTGQGMGLGLSISYGIVKDYGGEIRIRSARGLGSTFTLCFPAQRRGGS